MAGNFSFTDHGVAEDPMQGAVLALAKNGEAERCAALMELGTLGERGARALGFTERVVAICRTDMRTLVQVSALKTLGALGELGAKYLTLIVERLSSEEKQVKIAAIQAMALLGPHAKPALNDLQRLMADTKTSADIEAEAVMCLGSMEAAGTKSLVVTKLGGGEPVVRVAAVSALCMLGGEANEVRKAFSDSDAAVRRAALKNCMKSSEAADFVPLAAKLLGDADYGVRTAAAEFFIAQEDGAASAEVGTIKKSLTSSEVGVRAVAALALCKAGKKAVSEIQYLESMLDDLSEDTSYVALAVAGVLPKAPACMRKPACAAAFALRSMSESLGAHAQASASQVASQLVSQDWEVRIACLECLGAMGHRGAAFEAEVVKSLEDPYPFVVAKACATLGSLNESVGSLSIASCDAVMDLLRDKNSIIRAAAAEACGKMKQRASDSLDMLSRLLEDRVGIVRRAAIVSISKFGEVGDMYGPAFCRAMWDDPKTAVRIAAIEAVGNMGERSFAFMDELEMITKELAPGVAPAAVAALRKVEAARQVANAVKGEAARAEAEAAAAAKAEEEALAAAAAAKALEEEAAAAAALAEKKAAEAAAAQDSDVAAQLTPAAALAPAEPPLPVGLLFPGQGSQYVKMLSDAQHIPAVQDMLSKANEILGYDLLDLCLNGPESKLEQTQYCQPALFVGGLAAVEVLRQDRPEAVDRCQAVAGLSLGEYTALTVAGVFDFETGLRIVKLRGEAMQAAAQASEQSMLSVAGLEFDVLEKLCKQAAKGDICQIANHLFPKGFAVAGSKAAIERLRPVAENTKGCMQAKVVKTSGAFHTAFMKPASDQLTAALQEASGSMCPPRCDVYMNVTGARLERGSDPAVIVDMLGQQLTSSVMWQQAMSAMIEDQVTEFYECGPMKQLKAMMKRINQNVWKATNNIAV